MNNKSILSLLTFVVFLALAVGSSDDRTPEQKAEDTCKDTTMAFVMSQTFVKKRLKSPSTADFPYMSSEGVSVFYQGECKHQIFAYVDAQNSFGAMLRTEYYAEVQNEKGTDTWRLLDLKM